MGGEVTFLDLMLKYIDDQKKYKKTKHPDIDGKYILLMNINATYKKGDIIDSQNGYVHGVWEPTEKFVIEFTDKRYFKKL